MYMLVALVWKMFLFHSVSCEEEAFKYQVSKDVNGNPVCSLGPPDRTIHRIRSAIVCSGFCSLDPECKDFNFDSNIGVCQLFNESSTVDEVSIPNCKHYTPNHCDQKQGMEKLASTTGAATTATEAPTKTKTATTAASTTTVPSMISSARVSATTVPSSTLKTTTSAATITTSVMQTTKTETAKTTARAASAQVTGPTGLPYPTSGLVQQPSTSILIQNNVNTPNAFNRSWSDFKNGFADSNGNYWLGNDAVNNYLFGYPYQLYIYVYPVSEVYPYLAIYRYYFTWGDSTSKYLLTLAMGPGGNATSDGMGAMSYSMFSTSDKDNDIDSQNNCAAIYGAGWWYGGNPLSNGYACGTTMLNGCGKNFVWAQDTILTLRSSQMWLVY